VLYLDANGFIFATLNTEEIGARALALFARIQSGEEVAVTSALTFDEVFWEVKRNRGLEMALEASEAMLSFPNLEIAPASKELALSAVGLIRRYGLDPRDALHAATALSEGVDCVVTSDKHFCRVKELTVVDL